MNALAAVLDAAAAEIRALEADARMALDGGDSAGYVARMREKCLLLEDLPERVEPAAAALEPDFPDKARRARQATASMARRAAQALELESSFYMTNLLYADDHKDGDPTELEVLVRDLR